MTREPRHPFDAIDDFAGPGGWDEGARALGLLTAGVEHDDAACDTAIAAGHFRIRADVRRAVALPGGVRGYIASPPCDLFSNAGSSVGRLVLDVLGTAIVRIFRGADPASVRDQVVEQILPVTRAELVAANERRPAEKRWTADRVEARARRDAEVSALVLEPARRIVELEPEWIALEQVPDVAPLWTVYRNELRQRGYVAWATILNAADYGVPQTRRRAILGASRVAETVPPAPTHTEDPAGDLFGSVLLPWRSIADALGWTPSEDWPDYLIATNERPNAARRTPLEPAPTLAFGHEKPRWTWTDRIRNQSGASYDLVDQISRPATTIAGRGLVPFRGANANRFNGSEKSRNDGIRVTVAEVGVLQTFPADYPWRGSEGAQYRQVGDAVPPLLAEHVLSAITGRPRKGTT